VRHGDRVRKLGRTRSHRQALLRNLVSALVQHERIRTTLPKARQAQRLAERMMRLVLVNTLASRRQAARTIQSRTLLKKLFDEVGPRFAGRAGGCTRLYRLGHRPGDSAEVALLEFSVRKEPDAGRPARPARPRHGPRKAARGGPPRRRGAEPEPVGR